MEPLEFLKLVLDPQRLAVIGLVAAGSADVSTLARRAGTPERKVMETLAVLIAGGIVERAGDSYRLVPEALRDLARNLPQPEPPERTVFYGMTDAEGAVLSRFFQGRRLVEIPAAHGKRRVVLERIALDFEPGRRYPEALVNKMLGSYHEDYAALRRYLVDEGFLDRAQGEYWRAGGRVEPG